MASPGRDLVQEIKQRVDILEVVSEYVKLRPAGNRHVGLCPFHSEKTPSFGVSSERQSWYCFGCSEGGDVIKFFERIENVSFRETLERLAKRAGIAIPEGGGSGPSASERDRLRALQELACRFYEKAISGSSTARGYLAGRGVSDVIVRDFRLGFAPDSWEALRTALRRERASDDDLERAGLYKKKKIDEDGGYDFFRNRLIFPIFDIEGRVIAFGGRIMGEGQPKYLNSPDTPIFSKKRVLYGLHRALPAIKERREALVMEGYMDVLAAHEFGFTAAVAPLGTALTEDHLALFKRWCDRVLLIFDADGAGMKAALRSLGLFERSEIEARVVVLPAGEDPDSLLRKQGSAPFAQALEDARPILDYRMEAILSQHDIRSDDGFNKAMRSIAPLLSQVVSSNSWIHRIAELRSEGAPERVAFHEEDIRRKIRHTPDDASPREFQGKADLGKPQEGPDVGSATRRLYKAEDEILRACLEDATVATQLLHRIPPERFLRPETRELAALIAAHARDADWNPGTWVVDSDAVQTLMGRLAADPAPLHRPEKCASLLAMHWDKVQVTALTEGRTPTVEELVRIRQFYEQKRQSGSG